MVADCGLSPFLGGVLLGSCERCRSRSSRSRGASDGARSFVGDLKCLPGFNVCPLHWGQHCGPLPVGGGNSPLRKSVVHTVQWTTSQYSFVFVLGASPVGISILSSLFTLSRSANGRIGFTPLELLDEIVVVISSAGRASGIRLKALFSSFLADNLSFVWCLRNSVCGVTRVKDQTTE